MGSKERAYRVSRFSTRIRPKVLESLIRDTKTEQRNGFKAQLIKQSLSHAEVEEGGGGTEANADVDQDTHTAIGACLAAVF